MACFSIQNRLAKYRNGVRVRCDCHRAERPTGGTPIRNTVLIFVGIFFVSAVIAVGFAVLGLWLILPFTGLELILVAVVFYRCALQAKDYEVIAIDDDEIIIKRGCRSPGESISFQRYWARVRLVPPERRNEATRLVVSSHGRSIEVGAWLNEFERKNLADDLSRLINE